MAVFLLIEEWLWEMLTALGNRLSIWLHLQAFESWLAETSPMVAMSAFILPIALVLPIKFTALFLFAHGHFAQGIGLLLLAKLFATLLISRMFAVTRAQLLTFDWFNALYSTIVRWLSWAHKRIHATKIYQQARKLKQELAAWFGDKG